MAAYAQLNREPKGHEVRSIYMERLDIFDSEGQYEELNLRAMMNHARTGIGVQLSVWSAPKQTRPLFKQAVTHEFQPTNVGASFGPSWTTHWFRVDVQMPSSWKKYDVVQFEFDCNCEGMVYAIDGNPLQGLTGGTGPDRRHEFRLTDKMLLEGKGQFFVETGMNRINGNALGDGMGAIQPPNPDRMFILAKADLVAPNLEAMALFVDFKVIKDCAKHLSQDSWESHLALEIANEIMNNFELGSLESIQKCRKIAQKFIGRQTDSHRVYDNEHRHLVAGIGHCHIDTAWLWPFDETRRKTARSWSTQLDLMDRYPEHRFACSQAQQYAWLERDYPTLFARVTKAVKKGSFEPIGGSWVEMDANMPSGESIARQFLFGQRYFERHFGFRNKVFWLPDTFGYCAQLPQLCRLAGMDYGFTQKLSWNNINDFPNSTFNWVSLDGTQILMHMAPSNTYVAQGDVSELVQSVTKHKSLATNHDSLLVFGNGDGGGGPLAIMLEKLRRCRGVSDTIGLLPRVSMTQTVTEFFERIQKDTEEGKKLATWSGELYFEFHRGTFTSQATTKRNNRKTEILLHDIEFIATLASISTEYKYPKQVIDEMWEKMLLCQFHDVLPGSSIEMVYEDANQLYGEVYQAGEQIYQQACTALGLTVESGEKGDFALNCLPWKRSEYVGEQLASGSGLARLSEGMSKVTIEQSSSGFVMENERLRVVIENGVIVSLYDRLVGREIIPTGHQGGRFVIFDDQPPFWQAWDTELYSLDTRRELCAHRVSQAKCTSTRVGIVAEYIVSSNSSFKALISLSADSGHLEFDCTAEWHEALKFLKVEFPVDLQSSYASYESQFGITQRPTHFNTSWDYARFEVCSHKWADLSEYKYGVAILNDCKYGFATHGNCMRLSLLRSPKAPDAHADMGTQKFRFAIMPHTGGLDERVIRAGKEFNAPMRLVSGTSEMMDAIKIDGDANVILETVKRGENDLDVAYHEYGRRNQRTVVLRLYESLGGRGEATISTDFAVGHAYKTNIMEDEVDNLDVREKHKVHVVLRAFEIYTLQLHVE